MSKMSIRFIANHPALFVQKHRALVIADLHIGLEHVLYKDGIIISPQADKFRTEINSMIKMTKAKTLVIVGDLKHKVPGISFRELRETPKFFDKLPKGVRVVLTKGNHDTELKNVLPENVEFHGAKGFRIGDCGFFHGHAWPDKELMECDRLFMAHLHPAIEFKDSFGFRSLERVWVKGTLNPKTVKKKYKIKSTGGIGKLETIIIPSFNNLLSGIPLNSITKKQYIGPLIKSGAMNMSKAVAYMLDGTPLGKISRLKRMK